VVAVPSRLGRVLRTAPVSRQAKTNRVWHSPLFHSHPATFTGLRSVPFTVPSVFDRCAPVKNKTGRQLKTCGVVLRTPPFFVTVKINAEHPLRVYGEFTILMVGNER
jgi:hypothetical protein